MTSTAPTTTPKPRRGWLQFSLRTASAMPMLACLWCGATDGWMMD